MGTVPSPIAFVAGERVTAAKMNTNSVNAINFFLNKPICQLNGSASQNVAAAVSNLLLPTITFDTDSMADTANNRIVIKTPGMYKCVGQVGFSVNTSGYRFAGAYRNSNPIAVVTGPPVTVIETKFNFTGYVRCVAGDSFTLTAAQSSGGTVTAVNTTDGGVFLAVEWIGA